MALALFTDVIMVNLKGKSFLKLLDFSTEEIEYLIDYSAKLKQMKKQGVKHRFFEGKNIALLFEKNSTRTRCSFEVDAVCANLSRIKLPPILQKW